jgi:hypothetical protein
MNQGLIVNREYGRALRGKQIFAGRKFARQSIVAAKCGKEVIAQFGWHMQLRIVFVLGKNDAHPATQKRQ